MNKEELKLKLIDIFQKQSIICKITIDAATISSYERIFWNSFVNIIEHHIIAGVPIEITSYIISPVEWFVEDHERYIIAAEYKRLWDVMFPLIGKWFDDLEIKYSIEDDDFTGHLTKRYVIQIESLKEFSNFENLGTLI